MFSKLNMKYHDMQEDITKLKEELENLVDATAAIDETLGEDGALKLFMTEAMISVSDDTATSYVEQLQEEKQNELDEKRDKLEEMEGQMRDLKSYLYAKFGSSINLEEQQERQPWQAFNQAAEDCARFGD
eukprot:CAMPEP_0185568806 /NCGR_PEP_ID=MMETSP0434-20130131/1652_1 /TAXON_ID=626734 ORGANISM="Favella taraikaensis, Strain Fe Narragansett Bay" /NCGR_SAMPLE_ID=MMETSP0434 /ASSEMBLY_ACC=CAM_ASM_000379 /LENGTH=129 /DNA_ID=CAMNT_0028183427 /DNA_START=109 /DNA_END=499 /DNA_ORIENTATION=+